MSEDQQRIDYCRKHNVHHLFELLATKVLVERPVNPFEYLRELLVSVENSEKNHRVHDPTVIQYDEANDAGTEGGAPQKVARRKITLGIFGVSNAGKTTLLSALSGNIDKDCTPTVGFTPVRFQTDDYDMCIFDLGGAANFRGIWVHYFHDCHGFVYVVDSAAEESTVKESLGALRELAKHPYMAGKPILAVANKKDLATSRQTAVFPDRFLGDILTPGTPQRMIATCSIEEDACLESGVEWLLKTVSDHFESLEERVKKDTAVVKEERERQRAACLAALRADSNAP